MSELNLFETQDVGGIDEYLEKYSSRIIPDSEKVFVRDFLFPILGKEK